MKVLVSDSLAKEGVEILKKEKGMEVLVKTGLAPEELKKVIKDCDALVVRSATKVTADIIKSAKRLRIIGRAGVGLDNVDADAASRRGIIVMNTPGGNSISAAEHAISMMLALSRNIPQANASLKHELWEKKRFMGVEVYGKTLGVVGLGRIGCEVVRRTLAFGMRVITYDPFISLDKARQMEVELVDLKQLCQRSDYISVHSPLNSDTRHMFSENEFKMMKPGVRIINCARGGIVDEKALAKALQEKRVAGAALDVFETEPPKGSPLLSMDNVVVTPHLGASTEEAQVNVAVDIARQVADALMGRGIRNAVNVPTVDPEILKQMEPYINLAEKLGSFEAQLIEGRVAKVKVKYSGVLTEHVTSPISAALVKGLLTPIMGETVNYINAMVLAKERGIEVVESKSTEAEDFSNLISLEVETDKMVSRCMGSLFTKKDPRIVKIDKFYVEAIPNGYMLIISNRDKPGIIGNIGTVLGKNKINIAAMSFGREKPGGQAISVLNVDSKVSPDILEEIKKDKNILDVKAIKL